jgi:hypothetical protein
MMTRGKKIGLILSLALLALLLVLLWLLMQRRPAATPQPQESAILQNGSQPAVPGPTPEETQQERIETTSVQSLAKTFTERFGSYSTEASFQNIVDLYPLMTAGFEAQMQAMIDAQAPATEFYGVTTRIVSVTVERMDGNTASVLVATQREEERGTARTSSITYQDLRLGMVFDSGTWKVDSATWL